MRLLLATALLATALLATAATPALADMRGFPASGFDRVRSAGPFDVHIHTGQAASVHASGPKEVLDRLDIGVHGGELIVGTKRDSWWSSWRGWGRSERTVIDVTVPMVTGVALSGPGDVTVDRVRTRSFAATLSGPGDMTIGALEAGDADIRLSGPGTIAVNGSVGRARLSLSGPGDIKGKGLTAQDATVQLSGSGNIAINVLNAIDGRLSGLGDIWIGGHPHCAISKSGPGDVHCG